MFHCWTVKIVNIDIFNSRISKQKLNKFSSISKDLNFKSIDIDGMEMNVYSQFIVCNLKMQIGLQAYHVNFY